MSLDNPVWCFLEATIIISTGVLTHLTQINIIDLKCKEAYQFVPNYASVIFKFSVLCLLTKLRKCWPLKEFKPTWSLKFLMDLSGILFLTDFILRSVWIPILLSVNNMCEKLSIYFTEKPLLSEWLQNSAIYYARTLIALITFLAMIKISGCFESRPKKEKKLKDVQTIYENITQIPMEPEIAETEIESESEEELLPIKITYPKRRIRSGSPSNFPLRRPKSGRIPVLKFSTERF